MDARRAFELSVTAADENIPLGHGLEWEERFYRASRIIFSHATIQCAYIRKALSNLR